MNIDERLDRLTERHEALTQSVEMLTADIREMAAENRKRDERHEALYAQNRKGDERHEALRQSVEMLTTDIRDMAAQNRKGDERTGKQAESIGQIMEGIASLLHVAEIHERRLTDLEGGSQ